MKKRITNIISFFILVISCFGLIFSIYNISKWVNDNNKINKVTKNIKKKYITKEKTIENIDNVKVENKEINFKSLKNENSDTIGWLKVENTNINYPIVQTNNNDYYLNHSFNKKYNDAGWIFMDYRNDYNLNNKNTIIYGHSRLDKSMFGSLKNTLKSNWYKNESNHIISLLTENKIYYYKVFSTYAIETETFYITTNFSSNNDYINFLNELKNRSIYNYNVDVNENDKILTLSTCNGKTKKTVLHAKLIEK